ncbi:MAG: hypothetical protein GX838_04040 [Clostridiaceae bacterium]|nr:hypothetical protein [Clostridiaceae bacterium]
MPEGKKSVMFRFWLASDEKTLSSGDIDLLRERLLKKLEFVLGAKLRY